MRPETIKLFIYEMIRYDWAILRKYPVHVILPVFYALAVDRSNFSRVDRDILKPISKMKNCSSYLLCPLKLIEQHREVGQTEIAQYIELASTRSYNVYKNTGEITLPTYYVKGYKKMLEHNRLLIVTDETISFKYEEN